MYYAERRESSDKDPRIELTRNAVQFTYILPHGTRKYTTLRNIYVYFSLISGGKRRTALRIPRDLSTVKGGQNSYCTPV